MKTRKAVLHLKVAFFSFHPEQCKTLGKAGLTSQVNRGEVRWGCRGRRRGGQPQQAQEEKWSRARRLEGAQFSALGYGRLESPTYESEINAEKTSSIASNVSLPELFLHQERNAYLCQSAFAWWALMRGFSTAFHICGTSAWVSQKVIKDPQKAGSRATSLVTSIPARKPRTNILLRISECGSPDTKLDEFSPQTESWGNLWASLKVPELAVWGFLC